MSVAPLPPASAWAKPASRRPAKRAARWASNRSSPTRWKRTQQMTSISQTPNLPTGTVTFLFTDIEGSTRRWEENPRAMKTDIALHDVALREAIEGNGGHVFKMIGDAFWAVFATAPQALAAAVAAQRALNKQQWS